MHASSDTDRLPTAPPLAPGRLAQTGPIEADVEARPRRRPLRRRRSVWGESWRWLATALVFAVLAVGIGVAVLLAAVWRQARTDQARPADAIVVLGTAQWNGYPGTVLQARLDHALDLYRQGLAPVIVVTGGRMPGDEFTEAEAARTYLLEQGTPDEAILLENAGRDSWESMRGVRVLAEAAGVDSLLLVSDGFHLFRLKLMARDLGLSAAASPAPNSPIRAGGGAEFGYMVREVAGVVEQLLRGA
jgi:uncharacterized SAM-binding protein YcdF (DUF218 family)